MRCFSVRFEVYLDLIGACGLFFDGVRLLLLMFYLRAVSKDASFSYYGMFGHYVLSPKVRTFPPLLVLVHSSVLMHA